MIETIKINVPEGKKAVYDEATQTIKFEDVEPARSKSWEEFCKNNAAYDNNYIHINSAISLINEKLTLTEYEHFEVSKEDAEGILALIQLTRLHDEWVGDWNQDEATESISIYWYDHPEDANAHLPIIGSCKKHHLLKFPTAFMADEFLRCFKDLIVKAKRFL